MKSFHNVTHGGVSSTYRDLVRLYYWPGLRRTVSRTVKSCGVCIKNDPRLHAAQGSGVHPADRRPWRSIGVDHCGPYDGNGDRSKYLVVATCMLTGFIDAEVVGSTNASNLITRCRRIFARTGKPRRLCSDRGSAYISTQFRIILSKLHVQFHLVPSSSPKYGGKWECSHGPLNHKLRILRATHTRVDWRTLVAEAVSLSNSRLRWGSISSWDLLHTYDHDQTMLVPSLRDPSILNALMEKDWEGDRERVRQRLGERSTVVDIGDHVYLSTPSPGKLDDLARGPYLVTKISGGVYSLKEAGKVLCQIKFA